MEVHLVVIYIIIKHQLRIYYQNELDTPMLNNTLIHSIRTTAPFKIAECRNYNIFLKCIIVILIVIIMEI